MSQIITAAGRYTERQAYALLNPCRHAREWGPGDYRRVIHRGQVSVLTFLSFDWFENSKPCWHVAAAVMLAPDLLKAVALWDHNDRAQAIRMASDLIAGAGDVSKGRWLHKTEDGFDLYRAATPAEALMAQGAINGMAALPPFFDASAIPELEAMINGRKVDTDTGRGSATGTDGAGAPLIRRRTVTAERIGDA